MTGAYTSVPALEHELIATCLRRVASVRPGVAMVMAEVIEAETEHELGWLMHALTPAEATFALNLVWAVISEAGGQA